MAGALGFAIVIPSAPGPVRDPAAGPRPDAPDRR
jgi:hypothetical protein